MTTKQVGGGLVTTFRYLKIGALIQPADAAKMVMIIAWFDGDMDVYYSKREDANKAVEELKEYYKRDWSGTNRIIPIHVLNLIQSDVLRA